MTIQITKPETEALIEQCLRSGQFQNVDELLTEALSALRAKEEGRTFMPASNSLRDVFQAVKGMADEADFNRNPATGRRVDLS